MDLEFATSPDMKLDMYLHMQVMIHGYGNKVQLEIANDSYSRMNVD